jgi:hypothetical protein
MGSLSLSRGAACALLLVAAGCGAGEVTVEAIVPAGVSDDDLGRVRLFRVVASEGASGEVREASADAVGPLSIGGLPDGRWTFRLEASDEADRVLLQAKAGPVTVTRRGTTAVRALLAPVEAFSRLPVEGPEAEAIAALEGLSATTVDDGAGATLVLIAGGGDGDGVSRQAWVYAPAQLRFERVGDLRCPRAGHAAVAIERADGRQAVLIAGGGDARCVSDVPGSTAASTLELFDPERRAFELVTPGWGEPPDLSAAALAPAGVGHALLVAGSETWLLDVDAPWAAVEQYAWEEPGAASSTATALPPDRAAMVTGGRIFLLDADGNSCPALDSPGLIDPIDTATGTARDDWLLLTGEGRWEMLRAPGECSLDDEMFEGELGYDGAGLVATPLADGRVLLLGGDSGDSELILPPCSRTTAPLHRPGPESAHAGQGLAAAALPDGSALIVGGGEDAEVFNPWRWGRKSSPDDTCEWPEQTGVFGPGVRSDDDEQFRLLVVTDASPAADELRREVGHEVDSLVPGAWLESEGRRDDDGDAWAGALAATSPITRFEAVEGCEAAGDPEWVVVGDLGDLIYLASSEGDVENGMAVELANRIQLLGYLGACPVRQPLAVVHRLAAQLGAGSGDLVEALVPEGERTIPPGSILVTVIAAGDDCSNDPDYDGSEREPFDDAACAEGGEGMLDPEQVALEVAAAAEGFETAGISLGIAVVHRALDDVECELPARLASFAEALGPHGHAIAACPSRPLVDELSRVSNVASFLKYRVVCSPLGAASAAGRCAVALRWRDVGGDGERLAAPAAWTFDAIESHCDAVLRISPGFTGSDVAGFDAESFEQFQALCW